MDFRKDLKNKKRIVVKVGSSSLVHKDTGEIDFIKVERLIRVLSDLKNQCKDVVLVSSGAVTVGCKTLGLHKRPEVLSMIQACAAIGQGELMMLYQKLFMEYNNKAAQVLLTFDVITNEERRKNAQNTLKQLIDLDIIPIVNENDTIAIDELELEIGENDSLSALVAELSGADLLLILSDIDALYTDDPRSNPDAEPIRVVERITPEIEAMAGGAGSSLGTGGMSTKINAAKIATEAGIDMVIMNGRDPEKLYDLFEDAEIGTLFKATK